MTSPLSLSFRNCDVNPWGTLREISSEPCLHCPCTSQSHHFNQKRFEPNRGTMSRSSVVHTVRIPSVEHGTHLRPKCTTPPTTNSWHHRRHDIRASKDCGEDEASTSAVLLWYSVMLNFVYMLYFISGRLGDED
ncbi:unnamed protein product [Cylicocyclus nassatus]|uniref:Uncharacterized protein n=1 Tax=Cylicocyclus nassatus TaxID=53992 RepID=A0AA36MCP2_CYLNA|nr:unnamed protein product [Cylicocyclus nassatus]